jgi:hypothetical protein
MVDADLEFRIALLPPISRGAHLAGPHLHARRLVALWKVEPAGAVPLAQAFRLLGEATVARTILRRLAAEGYLGDPRYWAFPPIDHLLPELQEASWQALLTGTLLAEGIKGVRGKWGKQRRAVSRVELPRLAPDWELSRLTRGADDEFIDVQVRHATARPINWRKKPSDKDVADAMKRVAAKYPADAQPSEKEVWFELEYDLKEEVARNQVRAAIKNHAPQLHGRRGYRSKDKSQT